MALALLCMLSIDDVEEHDVSSFEILNLSERSKAMDGSVVNGFGSYDPTAGATLAMGSAKRLAFGNDILEPKIP